MTATRTVEICWCCGLPCAWFKGKFNQRPRCNKCRYQCGIPRDGGLTNCGLPYNAPTCECGHRQYLHYSVGYGCGVCDCQAWERASEGAEKC